ncbi:nucleoside-diphosphate sugar epimerase [Paenibacillus jamilae]|uniref:Nucleoside-diphosphate sugar epimerase n=1 Tax=Paenibacillus jamilae TaxID=114136 RepID=A0ACC4ZYI1_9BACL|nr:MULTISPECIES: NAD(P)H-binding protein [Paenibacillus]AUO05979.1 nucleoside-diphosphate sugar epimerase [Paenibacillus sp. lzh-N1]KTS83390.1 nucleoside-diphosphate sugar epimerase [Paenibacillus jamilae]
MERKAVVVGGTGLVGGYVVRELLVQKEYTRVMVMGRRPLDIKHPKLEQALIDWEKPQKSTFALEGVDDVFCCLGTTMKKAGSKERFRQVDLDYPVLTAQLGKEAGAVQMLAISAMGANPDSRVFYNRTKGEAEEALAAIGLPALHLFRPSLILGARPERRFGEAAATVVMKALDGLMTGRLASYRAIPASFIARAMVRIALAQASGVHIYPNDIIRVIGAELTSDDKEPGTGTIPDDNV